MNKMFKTKYDIGDKVVIKSKSEILKILDRIIDSNGELIGYTLLSQEQPKRLINLYKLDSLFFQYFGKVVTIESKNYSVGLNTIYRIKGYSDGISERLILGKVGEVEIPKDEENKVDNPESIVDMKENIKYHCSRECIYDCWGCSLKKYGGKNYENNN